VAAVALLVVCGAPLVGLWRFADGLPLLRATLLGVLGIAAAVPDGAVLLCLAGVPLSAAWSVLGGFPIHGAEFLVLTAIAGWACRTVFSTAGGERRTCTWTYAAGLAALVVLCSVVVELALIRERLGPETFRAAAAAAVGHDYFIDRGPFESSRDGLVFLESLALFVIAGVTYQRHPQRTAAAIRVLVLGGAGAACLNLARLGELLARSSEPLLPVLYAARNLRINIGYGDVNAAGSYFALCAVAACGLADGTRRGALAVFILGGTLFAALWMTGSRAAVGAFLLFAFLLMLKRRRDTAASSAGPRTWWVAVATLAAASVLFVTLFPNAVAGHGAAVAIQVRTGMARVALALFRSAPIFGIGVGRFFDASADAISSLQLSVYYTRENAHNNFLQVAAELGLAGILTFGWLLILIGYAWRARVAESRTARLDDALRAGLLALGATALLGHPLLTAEVSFVFWPALGCSLAYAAQAGTPRRLSRWIAAGAACALLVSVPFRLREGLASAYLEHVGWGVTNWTTDSEGFRYRRVLERATIFFPGDAKWIEIPYKNGSSVPVTFTLSFRGREANRLIVSDQIWHRYILDIPHRDAGPRSESITIDAPGAEDLRIGKLIPH
jgi:O-antigen ligase